jgi:hypothetical protein
VDAVDEHDLPAGSFSAWRRAAVAAIEAGAASDVPCGTCTACCRSSQFVHVGPDEADALAHIPASLLFPAPGRPRGHLLLGYDERGRCPMLGDSGCTIYDHRPLACRVYDCRVFAAADVEPDDHQPAIAAQVRRWRFSYPSDDDRREHDAVRAVAARRSAHDPSAPRLAIAVRAVADDA